MWKALLGLRGANKASCAAPSIGPVQDVKLLASVPCLSNCRLLLLLPLLPPYCCRHCCRYCCHPRNGHSESRRSRRLVISFIATVVNYEYAMYWYLYQVCYYCYFMCCLCA